PSQPHKVGECPGSRPAGAFAAISPQLTPYCARTSRHRTTGTERSGLYSSARAKARFMNAVSKLIGLVPFIAGALVAVTLPAAAQDKPVTPPDSYRVVMENERVRMIEVHVKPHSKVNVDSEPGRERFLYMLSDGAL